jgi:hypothetical protein
MAETVLYREVLAWPEDHTEHCGFVCSICGAAVDLDPCPDHAPTQVPGLQIVHCEAEPRHWLWMLDSDAYPPPCYRCELDRAYERERLGRQCRHWPWRRWRVLWLAYRWVLEPVRLASGFTVTWSHGDGHDGCQTWRWRWSK